MPLPLMHSLSKTIMQYILVNPEKRVKCRSRSYTLCCSINLNSKCWPVIFCCRPETDELGPWKTLHVVHPVNIWVWVTCEYLESTRQHLHISISIILLYYQSTLIQARLVQHYSWFCWKWNSRRLKNCSGAQHELVFQTQQDWLSPVYSGRLQYVCWNSFYTDTPVHWCTIRS